MPGNTGRYRSRDWVAEIPFNQIDPVAGGSREANPTCFLDCRPQSPDEFFWSVPGRERDGVCRVRQIVYLDIGMEGS